MKTRRWRNWVVGSFCFLMLLGLVVGGVYKVEGVLVFQPGRPSDTQDFVEITGIDAEPTDSEVLLTTTVLINEPSALQYFWLKYVDNNNSFEEAETFFPSDTTDEEFDEQNEADMVLSQSVAEIVALERLGLIDLESRVIIANVMEDSAGDGVLEPSDVIVALDGTPIQSSVQLVELVAEQSPGDELVLTVSRGQVGSATEIDAELTLGEDPNEEGRPLIGINPTDVPFVSEQDLEELGISVEFDSNEVGGPSAGLALTIEIIDQLTEGDLLGGVDIAFTGVIRLDGSVGPIGGLPQKTVGVRDRDIEYFMVPTEGSEEDLEQALEWAGDDLEIIQVENLDEALSVIQELGGNTQSLDVISRS